MTFLGLEARKDLPKARRGGQCFKYTCNVLAKRGGQCFSKKRGNVFARRGGQCFVKKRGAVFWQEEGAIFWQEEDGNVLARK